MFVKDISMVLFTDCGYAKLMLLNTRALANPGTFAIIQFELA